MADEVIAGVALTFLMLNLSLGAVGFVIGVSTDTFDSFEGIQEQLVAFGALAPDLQAQDPSRDRNVDRADRQDDFDCNLGIDGIVIPCEANPIFPLYPPDPANANPIFSIFQTANFFGNLVNVIRAIWSAVIFVFVIPVGFALGAFEMLMLIPPYIGGISPIGLVIGIADAFITIAFGISFILTMIARIKP